MCVCISVILLLNNFLQIHSLDPFGVDCLPIKLMFLMFVHWTILVTGLQHMDTSADQFDF